MSAIRIAVPKTARKGELIELKALIQHDMESGYRRDGRGKVIARNILTHFSCHYDETEIFSAEFGPGISANPIIAFHTIASHSGVLHFRWTEQTGQVFSQSAPISVR